MQTFSENKVTTYTKFGPFKTKALADFWFKSWSTSRDLLLSVHFAWLWKMGLTWWCWVCPRWSEKSSFTDDQWICLSSPESKMDFIQFWSQRW
jgi:hypothetical protein